MPGYAFVTGVLVILQGSVYDDLVMWAFRGFISLTIAIIAYFLKKMYDDYQKEKEAKERRIAQLEGKYEAILRVTAAHEVMYEYWLESLVDNPHPEYGHRKTDKLHDVIKKLAEGR